MNLKHVFIILSITCFIKTGYSQISIDNLKELPKIKQGTTFVVMRDTTTSIAKTYMDIYRSEWKFSKLAFIQLEDVDKNMTPTSSFITIGDNTTTTQSYTRADPNRRIGPTNPALKPGISYSNTHIYLELWTCNESYFSQTNKAAFKPYHPVTVAHIELFTDYEVMAHPDLLYEMDYDGGGHIRNWSPGILKNYLRLLHKLLDRNEKRWQYANEINEKALAKLKRDTLFVPDYILVKFNKRTGNESKKHDKKDVFKDYKYKYALISAEALSQKILETDKPFYYLIYVKGSTDKYISVFNAQTGDMIYTRYKPVSYNIAAKDFKKLVASIH